ncbi:TadE/TadG family type IV pilus assembly protein [Candidatus Laterigemmans baculatus]|uniref:TadE/TadG family type IV pilus assembly protein n=1 Tax=Candidatus Laterigemmans baculatus TaxID=2770505 RepID=UPI001F2F1A49|nr:TadE/TadG family type IV pilus assembly protein [Candidatus Laterigemmans baculatus]
METAIALPLLLVLVFGAVELADGIFLKQALTVAAYEGAREVTRQKGTAAAGQRRIDEVLAARGITEYGYSVEPVATEETPRSTRLTVRLTAPVDSVSWSPLRLFTGKTIEKTVSMVRQ